MLGFTHFQKQTTGMKLLYTKCTKSLLVRTVLIFVAGERIARIGRIHAIIVHFYDTHVPIDKPDDALGVVIERRVGFAGLALVPGQRSVRRPFHDQERMARVADRSGFLSRNIWHARQIDSVEAITPIIKLRALAKR